VVGVHGCRALARCPRERTAGAQGKRVVAAAAAKRHTVVLTAEGDVHTWGHRVVTPRRVNLAGAPRGAPPPPPPPPNRHGAFFQAAVSSQIAVRSSDAPCPASRACRCACRQRSGAGAGGGALRADRCGRRRLARHAAAGRGHGGGRGGRQPYCQRWCGQRRRQGLRAGVPPRPGRGDTRGRQCRPEALARMARCCAGGRCRRTCPCVQRQ